MSTHQTAVIFFCHGSRDPQWREPFDAIADQFRQSQPDRQVKVAFLEMMEPRLESVIDQLAGDGVSSIHVLPLFLAAGAHTRRDLPELIDQAKMRWPQVQFSVSPALTDAQPMRDAIVSWAAINATS